MSELPDLSAQKPYALDQLAQLQGKIVRLSQSMVLQRARIERCRQSDLAAARDIYAELSRTRETLVEALAQAQLFLMEMEEYALAKVSGQLRQGLAGFALMSTGYKSVYEALSRFASSLPVGQKTNAAVVGRLMNNIKLGYYPTDPDNIDLLLRGIRFPEGVTTNLLDPCCGCGKALRQLAQGNNCYAYGVELDESRAEEAQTRLHRVGFGSFFHSSISREAFHLLFLNPPYLSVINESGGRSRHEKRFLIESLPALAYGGLLIYVIPYYRLTPDICRILVDNFDDLSVWRFTEREFRKFKQVAVLGIRKPRETEPQDTLWLEELASAPMSIRSLAEMPEERYALPDHPIEVNTFKGERFNQKELEQQLRRCRNEEGAQQRTAGSALQQLCADDGAQRTGQRRKAAAAPALHQSDRTDRRLRYDQRPHSVRYAAHHQRPHRQGHPHRERGKVQRTGQSHWQRSERNHYKQNDFQCPDAKRL